ncbi:MAG: class I SAM-dependent methyltransferase [Candidatus Paceibacterota bacterium]|jgi:23S rRNA (cytosine1962-C5)-methyltransferase
MKNEIKIFTPENWIDYEILDTGEGERLERFGKYTFIRPFEDAVWKKTLNKSEWEKADGKFWSSKTGAKGGWKINSDIPEKWIMSYGDTCPVRGHEGSQCASASNGIKFFVSPTPFRHFGFFPEQASHWDFIESKIKKEKRPIKFLNLFGYTGVASLFALRAGAEVTHLDASKQSLSIAKENQILSGLEKMPMRIICDDVLKFLEREAKRGNKYDAVIMDPPKFGRGPKGETWKIEESLPKLLAGVKKVLSDNPLFVILTSYAIDSSSLSLGCALRDAMKDFKGEVKQGELCLVEKSNDRLISLANTAVWES